MSRNSIKWAFAQRLPSSQKLVLLSFAYHANTQNHAWPCIKQLSETTGLNRKTVILAVADLKSAGLIFDTGDRVGKTNQGIVYHIGKEPQKRASLTVPIANPLSPVQRVPKTGHGIGSKHRPKNPLSKKAKIVPSLRLVVGGE